MNIADGLETEAASADSRLGSVELAEEIRYGIHLMPDIERYGTS